MFEKLNALWKPNRRSILSLISQRLVQWVNVLLIAVLMSNSISPLLLALTPSSGNSSSGQQFNNRSSLRYLNQNQADSSSAFKIPYKQMVTYYFATTYVGAGGTSFSIDNPLNQLFEENGDYTEFRNSGNGQAQWSCMIVSFDGTLVLDGGAIQFYLVRAGYDGTDGPDHPPTIEVYVSDQNLTHCDASEWTKISLPFYNPQVAQWLGNTNYTGSVRRAQIRIFNSSTLRHK